jgi:hypothetical protein
MGITFIMIIGLDDCHDALYAHDGVHLVFFMKGFLPVIGRTMPFLSR